MTQSLTASTTALRCSTRIKRTSTGTAWATPVMPTSTATPSPMVSTFVHSPPSGKVWTPTAALIHRWTVTAMASAILAPPVTGHRGAAALTTAHRPPTPFSKTLTGTGRATPATTTTMKTACQTQASPRAASWTPTATTTLSRTTSTTASPLPTPARWTLMGTTWATPATMTTMATASSMLSTSALSS